MAKRSWPEALMPLDDFTWLDLWPYSASIFDNAGTLIKSNDKAAALYGGERFETSIRKLALSIMLHRVAWHHFCQAR